ncbi:hypothetical protein [Lysobacter firmicutimachus]|uniref:Lipoprotein n=1 Tax=Lysobacter firmicutimachus TaxID=1792846 RepID=A0ABU8D4V3_9GAMM
MKASNLLGLALLTVLAGCNSPTAPGGESAAASAPAAAATAPASEADAAPATAAPAATEAAAAPAGDGRSLCAANEDIVFACKLGGGQLASICASKGANEQSGYVYFAQGAGRAEYRFPADNSAPAGRFKRTQLGFAGNSGGYAYSFEDAGSKRIFYSISGEAGMQEQGLMTVAAGAATADSVQACESGSVVDDIDDALFKFTRSWGRDDAIDRSGLPAKS